MSGHLRTIWGAVSLIGFAVLLETAGMSDLNEISAAQALIQGIIGLALFAGGAKMGGFMQ